MKLAFATGVAEGPFYVNEIITKKVPLKGTN